MVEATIENMNVELSQGSHFFHNLTSFMVSYFSVKISDQYRIDWEWLKEQQVVNKTDFVTHVTLPSSLNIKVDGRSGKGVISKS